MLLRRGPLCIPARFGEKSCARHVEAAREAGIELDLLTTLEEAVHVDLDTPDDAERVIRSGRSCRTRDLLRSFAR
jgi:2-phospho-L-lactate guanylyltransferase (CobY/MobA/RfbA family)